MSDEMSGRKQILWNENSKQFEGFPIVNSSKSAAYLSAANNILVIMVVGNDSKLAVAYFFLNGLQAIDSAVLNKEIIISLQNTGAKLVSLTGDGLSANIPIAKLLGANFNSNQPYFALRNSPNEKIYVIFDPPHILKLIRRYFTYHQLYYKDHKLKWELLETLAKKQDNDIFALGNKLSRNHIQFKTAPMNVTCSSNN